MKSSASTPGTIVHLLSQVEFSVSESSKKSESFHAVQFRPLKPLVGWNFSNFILSRVKTINPLSFDMNEEKYSKEMQPHRFMLIPLEVCGTLEEAFKIAVICQERGADAVIIGLPPAADLSTLAREFFEDLVGAQEEAKQKKVSTIAMKLSERSYTELENINIPVLALMYKVAEKLAVARRNGILSIQINSLDTTFRGGETYLWTNFEEQLRRLIGAGTLDDTKLLNFKQFLCEKTSLALSLDEKQACFRTLRELSDVDTFPIGMEMAEFAFEHFKEEDQDVLNYFYSYIIDVKWTRQCLEIAKSYSLCLDRIKCALRANKNLDSSIAFLAFLCETDEELKVDYFHGEWQRIIDVQKNKEQAIRTMSSKMSQIKTAGHQVPFTYACFDLVIKAVNNNGQALSLCVNLFQFFETPPSDEKESLIVANVTKKSPSGANHSFPYPTLFEKFVNCATRSGISF